MTQHAIDTAPADCHLAIASTGRKAIELVEEHAPEELDLVLLDLDLPDRPGHEVCEKIRQGTGPSEVPIVVLTSSFEPEDVEASYEAGANGHVTKSISFQDFREDLAVILTFWLQVNETIWRTREPTDA